MTQPRDPIDVQKELIAHTFGQAQAYTNVVLTAGYAGFFAIWSFLKPELTKGEIFWSALLISISLATFVLWEVFQSYYRSRSMLSLAKTVEQPELFQQRIEEYRRDESDRVVSLRRVWIVAFALTVFPGFTGVLVLLSAFVRSIYKLYVT